MRDQAGGYCHRLATWILLINNLQPELQNSAAPSTRWCNAVSRLPNTIIDPLGPGPVHLFSYEWNIRPGPITLLPHPGTITHCTRKTPALPTLRVPACLYLTSLLPLYPNSSPLPFLAPSPLLPLPPLPRCLPTLTSLYTWSCQHLLQGMSALCWVTGTDSQYVYVTALEV